MIYKERLLKSINSFEKIQHLSTSFPIILNDLKSIDSSKKDLKDILHSKYVSHSLSTQYLMLLQDKSPEIYQYYNACRELKQIYQDLMS